MPSSTNPSSAPSAILVLAEIKAAVETFDRGEANAFDAVDAIIVVVEAYQAAAQSRRKAA
ncbi:MAG: hypothetical protein WCR51_02345 [Planctomycetia bacterium]